MSSAVLCNSTSKLNKYPHYASLILPLEFNSIHEKCTENPNG